MSVLWEIDPVSEDATNVPLALVDSTFRLTEMDLTPPEVDPIVAASADTEGDPYVGSRHRNRTISLTFIALASTNALLQTAIYGVQQKIDKLRREGGTLKMTTQAGTTVVGDVNFAQFKPEFTPEMYVLNRAIRFTLDFDCKPYFRGAPVQQNDHTETVLPCLVFTETTLGGDVPGLGKLIIDEDQGVDQSWVIWGLQSRYYDSATSAALFYEAEGRTGLSGSTTTAGPTGASGGGSNVMRNTNLMYGWQAILSTQTSGGGAHLSHVGTFRVFARVQTPTTNTGAVSLALEWSEGDFLAFDRNAAVTFPVDAWDGTWRLVDLGQVRIGQTLQGTQCWEGRVLASSTVIGDDIDIDWLMLVPADEGSAEVSAVQQVPSFTSISAHDEFEQAAGALTGKTLPLGGTWVGAGDATDFSVPGGPVIGYALRTEISDADVNSGRFAIAGTTTFTSVVAQVDLQFSGAIGEFGGALARYTDTSNWLMAAIYNPGSARLDVRKRVAGTVTTLGQTVLPGGMQLNLWYTLRLVVDTAGRWTVWIAPQGAGLGIPVAQGVDTALATAGALASGKSGFYDCHTASGAVNRYYDNFVTGVGPPRDAAMFASQSLEIRADRVIREDSAGALWTRPSRYEGDYLRVPPAGKEARSVRFIVKPSRGVLLSDVDGGIDDVSARLTYTPRYLVLPT